MLNEWFIPTVNSGNLNGGLAIYASITVGTTIGESAEALLEAETATYIMYIKRAINKIKTTKKITFPYPDERTVFAVFLIVFPIFLEPVLFLIPALFFFWKLIILKFIIYLYI